MLKSADEALEIEEEVFASDCDTASKSCEACESSDEADEILLSSENGGIDAIEESVDERLPLAVE
jgi:hypothetical protein